MSISILLMVSPSSSTAKTNSTSSALYVWELRSQDPDPDPEVGTRASGPALEAAFWQGNYAPPDYPGPASKPGLLPLLVTH